jgi:hypothetical protein
LKTIVVPIAIALSLLAIMENLGVDVKVEEIEAIVMEE